MKYLNNYTIEIINNISEVIGILDDNYGDRNLGGYAVIVENIVDIEIIKQDKLQGIY